MIYRAGILERVDKRMIRVAVFGYGNVGKAVVEACLNSGDMELVGIVGRSMAGQVVDGFTIAADVKELPEFDVAILSLPTRMVPYMAERLLKKGICSVDSYDIHTSILEVRAQLDKAAKEGGSRAVTAAGWDPGSDSVIRTMMEAMAPKGVTYTNFGPGMSMGHSVAVKAIEGVKDALSVTIPTGTGIHRRMVYVELEEGYTLEQVTKMIKADDYFVHDETYVNQVTDIRDIMDVGHGVHIERKGVSGMTHNQLFEFNMKINNPALTAQVMVCAARAAMRQQPGCYTLIEIPPVDFLEMSREEAVKKLV